MRLVVNPGMTVFLVVVLPQTPGVSTAQERTSPAPSTMPASVVDIGGQLGASINNAGAQLSFDLSRRRPLSRSRHPLLSEVHVAVGGTAAFTPANVRGGGWVEAASLSTFVLRAGVEPAYYFGSFDSLASFDRRSDAFGSDSRRERGGAMSGTTTRFYLTPTLRLRARRFIGLASADVERWSSSAPGPLFYEPTRDTLLATNGDRVTTVTGAVLYEHPLATGRVITGITHARMRVGGESLNEVRRLGVVVVRQSAARLFALDKPSITVSAARYLDDPSKQGEWTASLAIGFSLHR